MSDLENTIIAFGSIPKGGGTYTFYRTIRPKLLECGIDMRCVSVGKTEADLIEDAFVDSGCVLLGKNMTNIKEQAMVFADWCEKTGVDIVFAINSVGILSALPHLPVKIRVMSRVASISDHGYRITASCYERIMRIIATAPRHVSDLAETYGVEKDRLHLIPNGIIPALFNKAAQHRRGEESVLRLGFLGRFEHNHKGVLFLPEIIRRLHAKGLKFSFYIAGKGVYGQALKKEFKKFIQVGSVKFVGTVSPGNIPDFLESIDVLIFPSQLEGCPNVLLEALMAGCVPVAWVIDGVTDYIIKDGCTGFVCPLGDFESFADRVVALADNRHRLQKMSKAAAEDARSRFSHSRLAKDYAKLIKKVMMEPNCSWQPLPWSDFILDPAFKESYWRNVVPSPLKKIIKNSLFKLGMSRRYE